MRQSRKIFHRSLKKIPGGVNSPVRAWKAVGGDPLIIARGHGSRVIDADGKRYIDFVGSWGPLMASTAAHWLIWEAHESVLVIQRVKTGASAGFDVKPMRHPVIA